MAVGRGGFRRRVRDALGCERGNTPEWTMPAVLVLVATILAVVWLGQAYPDRAAALEARLEPYRPALDLLYRLMLIGAWVVCALVLGLFAWAAVRCWLEGRRGRMGPPGAGSGGGAEVGGAGS